MSAERGDWAAAARKLRIIGLTQRKKTSPNTWRWQQHAEWATLLPANAIKNVSVTPSLYRFIGDLLPKASQSFRPELWADPAALEPQRDANTRSALALAVRLYDLGRDQETRQRFAALLSRQHTCREGWLRSLIGELKR